jgi:hypothetical protein
VGGKGGWCVGRIPYNLHVPIVLKSGRLNLLETSESVQDSEWFWRLWAQFWCFECKMMCLCWLLYFKLLFLFLYVMKTCGVAEVRKNVLFTSALNSDEWRASRLGLSTARSKISRWSFNRRLAGFQSPSGRYGEEDNVMTLPRMQSVCCTKQRRFYTVTRITVAHILWNPEG